MNVETTLHKVHEMLINAGMAKHPTRMERFIDASGKSKVYVETGTAYHQIRIRVYDGRHDVAPRGVYEITTDNPIHVATKVNNAIDKASMLRNISIEVNT